MTSDRVVLDLCAGSRAWSKPYAEAGYIVIPVELEDGQDVRLMRRHDVPIHGILAAPPCTMFCRMRMCRGEPTEEQFREALSVVDACLRAVVVHRPRWWALENPQGYLSRWLGPPSMKFDPWEYGDPWTKRTWVWGEFARPMPTGSERSSHSLVKHHVGGRQVGIARNFEERARTPEGFSRAFFEANP